MSDEIFHEASNIDGSKYKFGDWKRYAVHTTETISGFFGSYRFLSNFEPSKVWYEKLCYPTVENAYQAAKLPESFRSIFAAVSPVDAKKLIRKPLHVRLIRKDWHNIKLDIMTQLVFQKFINPNLKSKLLLTNKINLEETNHWGDVYWGYCVKKQAGENNLGKILMKVRWFWQN